MNPFINASSFSPSPGFTDKLTAYGIIRTFAEGETIVNERAYIKAIPIVVRGSIRVMRTDEEGREILLYYIRPGESCIMSFLGGMHSTPSIIKAVSEEETEVMLIPASKVSMLIKEFPEWLDYIFLLYHQRFEELLDVVNSIAFKRMDERLLNFLRKKQELMQSDTLQVTHEQLAAELGTARTVVSRLLKQMETEGLVKLGRNKIILQQAP